MTALLFDRRIVAALVIAGTIVLIGSLPGVLNLGDGDARQGERHALSMVQKAAHVDTLAIGAPHPVFSNYDSLVAALKELRAVHRELPKAKPGSAVAAALDDFVELLAKRSRQIETLKSNYAAQRNARQSLVRWISEANPDPKSTELRRALGVYVLSPSNQHEATLTAAVEKASALPEVTLVKRHVEVLTSTETTVSTLLTDILSSPLKDKALNVHHEYVVARITADGKKATIRLVALFILVLGSLAAVWVRPREVGSR